MSGNKIPVNVVPPTSIEGEPDALAQQLAQRYLLEVAAVVQAVWGHEGLVEYYTALASCVLCQAQIFLGSDIAELIGETCTRNAVRPTPGAKRH